MARVDRDVQRQFWVLIRDGVSVVSAAEVLGLNRGTTGKWFREAGGMPPMSLVELPSSSRYLSIAEREAIHAGIHAGHSIRQIGRTIGRPASTVLREVRANMYHQQYRSRASLNPHAAGRPVTAGWRYSPSRAHARGRAQRARGKDAKLAVNDRLRAEVQRQLLKKRSPEQISRRLRLDFPDDPEMWVSHETIYQSIYVQGRGALRRELATCLRTGRALRKPHRVGGERRGRNKDMVLISERPAEVEDRAVPGHWEGDLIVGKDSASAIGTLVERSTGFLMLLHLPDRHGALEVQEQMITQMGRLPQFLRKSTTWDQGSEMANHQAISTALEMDIYFCDPHSPWQRGSNENTNGLLRQYFPKGTDLSGYHPDYLDFVAHEMNDRPRKRHDWLNPEEKLLELLSNPPQPPGVASTG